MGKGRPPPASQFKYVLLAWILVLAFSAAVVPCCSGRMLLAEAGGNAASPNHSSAPPSPASHPKVPAPAPVATHSPDKSINQVLWVFLIGPIVFLICLLTLLGAAIVCLRRKRKRATVSPWKAGMSGHMSGQLQKAFVTGVPTISRAELEAACEDFSNVIGSSSDSMVFKGTLTNGTEIAVTSIKIPPTSWTPNTELYFRRKVEALARMNHRNLVNLIAYCSEEEPFERMLVFEYAPNGTLFEHLHNKESEHLDWPMRMRIVMGAAYGLQYMHHELVPPTSHLNFDSNSVYLTEDYAAKVADFGISKLSVGTNLMGRRKSFGKFVNDDQCTDRHTPDFESNVLSFGVFLLETITARSNVHGSLIEYAKEYLNDPKMMWYMVDSSLESYNTDELVAICEIVRLCIQPKASKRPSMREVTWMLSNALQMSPEAASCKVSPLLWAELELISPMDNSSEEPETALTSGSVSTT
ncbi:unnamed protein product [Calypogeia fissa]